MCLAKAFPNLLKFLPFQKAYLTKETATQWNHNVIDHNDGTGNFYSRWRKAHTKEDPEEAEEGTFVIGSFFFHGKPCKLSHRNTFGAPVDASWGWNFTGSHYFTVSFIRFTQFIFLKFWWRRDRCYCISPAANRSIKENQIGENVRCIYVATGQKPFSVAEVATANRRNEVHNFGIKNGSLVMRVKLT